MTDCTADVCQIEERHQEAIERAREQMVTSPQLQDLADLFKVFGEPTRLRILSALNAGELCVCDLVDLLGMSQSAVSHQLRILRSSRVVRFRKEGKNVYYTLDDDHVRKLLELGLDHVNENRA